MFRFFSKCHWIELKKVNYCRKFSCCNSIGFTIKQADHNQAETVKHVFLVRNRQFLVYFDFSYLVFARIRIELVILVKSKLLLTWFPWTWSSRRVKFSHMFLLVTTFNCLCRLENAMLLVPNTVFVINILELIYLGMLWSKCRKRIFFKFIGGTPGPKNHDVTYRDFDPWNMIRDQPWLDSNTKISKPWRAGKSPYPPASFSFEAKRCV
jgi:hypothetical protein